MARFRRPEYTGENRCIPCTATNVVIACLLSVGVGVLFPPAGVALFALSLAAIWLRGYLVPGTPELTKRYFPDWLLAYFDKGPATAGGFAAEADGAGGTVDGSGGASPGPTATDSATADGTAPGESTATDDASRPARDLDPEVLLLDADVVEPCAEEDDLCLVDGFREAWHDRMVALRESGADRAALGDRLDVDPDDLRFEEHESGFEAFDENRRLGQWESRAALLADLAAAEELPDWIDDWDDLAPRAHGQVLGGLRVFLETCPSCDGRVTAGTETVESCCRSHEVVAVACDDCGARLLEVPYREE